MRPLVVAVRSLVVVLQPPPCCPSWGACDRQSDRGAVLSPDLLASVQLSTLAPLGETRHDVKEESTAYVICQALNLDMSDYSSGYVAGWAGGGEQAIDGINGSCERIQKAAASVLQSFEVGQEQAA